MKGSDHVNNNQVGWSVLMTPSLIIVSIVVLFKKLIVIDHGNRGTTYDLIRTLAYHIDNHSQ